MKITTTNNNFLIITNDPHNRQDATTNFLATDYNRNGFFHLAINARAFRLLVPDVHVEEVTRELALVKRVKISREPSRMYVLLDDDSDSPFGIDLDLRQLDVLPSASDSEQECLFTAWTRGPADTMKKIFEMKCVYTDYRGKNHR